MSQKVWVNAAAALRNLHKRFAARTCPFWCRNSGTKQPPSPPLPTFEFQDDGSVPKDKVVVWSHAGVLDSSQKELIRSSLKPPVKERSGYISVAFDVIGNDWRDVMAAMELERQQKWEELIKKAKEARAAAAAPSTPAASFGTLKIVGSQLPSTVDAVVEIIKEIRSDIKEIKMRGGGANGKKDSNSGSKSSDDEKP